MVPVEESKEHADSRREQQQTVFGESVGDKEAAPVTYTNLVLRLLVVPVQGREIDIRGRLVDVDFLVRRAEDTNA